jgi:hypothetical protein
MKIFLNNSFKYVENNRLNAKFFANLLSYIMKKIATMMINTIGSPR